MVMSPLALFGSLGLRRALGRGNGVSWREWLSLCGAGIFRDACVINFSIWLAAYLMLGAGAFCEVAG